MASLSNQDERQACLRHVAAIGMSNDVLIFLPPLIIALTRLGVRLIITTLAGLLGHC